MTISFNLYRFLVFLLFRLQQGEHMCIHVWSQSWMTTAEYKVVRVNECKGEGKRRKRFSCRNENTRMKKFTISVTVLQMCRSCSRFRFISGNLHGATDCKCYCVRTIRHLTMNESCECGHFILCPLLSLIILMWFHLPVDIKKYKKFK